MSDSMDYSLYYNLWHNDSVAHFKEMSKFYRLILQPILSSLGRDSRILDVGCGQGLLAYALKDAGFTSVEGIDISAQQIDVAKSKGLNCKLVERDFTQRLATSNPASYELIFLMDVLEHVPKSEQPALVSSLSQLLVPGGSLVVSVPNANSVFGMRWRYDDWTHECSFTEHSLRFLLLNRGFRTVEVFPYEFVKRPKHLIWPTRGTALWLLNRLVRGLRRAEAFAELGGPGLSIPLSLNILGRAVTATEGSV